MLHYFTPLARMKRAGWSVSARSMLTDRGLVWWVDGARGTTRIHAEGITREEAWQRAVEQARNLGTFARTRRET